MTWPPPSGNSKLWPRFQEASNSSPRGVGDADVVDDGRVTGGGLAAVAHGEVDDLEVGRRRDPPGSRSRAWLAHLALPVVGPCRPSTSMTTATLCLVASVPVCAGSVSRTRLPTGTPTSRSKGLGWAPPMRDALGTLLPGAAEGLPGPVDGGVLDHREVTLLGRGTVALGEHRDDRVLRRRGALRDADRGRRTRRAGDLRQVRGQVRDGRVLLGVPRLGVGRDHVDDEDQRVGPLDAGLRVALGRRSPASAGSTSSTRLPALTPTSVLSHPGITLPVPIGNAAGTLRS